MFFSFGNMSGGQFPGPLEDGSERELRNAMLIGFPQESLPEDFSEVQWDIAQAWDEALAHAGAARPRTISKFKEIADIYWLADKVSPFELDSPVLRKRKTAEQLKAMRDKTENLIVRFLDVYENSL